MRQEFILGDPTAASGYPNTFQVSLWWKPTYMIILNQTSNTLFLNEGNTRIPSPVAYTTPVPASAPYRLPTNSKEFAGLLVLTPPLTDANAIAKIIFTDEE